MPPTAEMKPAKEFKNHPLTIGALITLMAGAGALAGFVIKAYSQVDAASLKQVERHQDRPVDRAHTDLKSSYVPREEVGNKLHAIQVELKGLQTTQQTILIEIRRGNGHRRTRRDR